MHIAIQNASTKIMHRFCIEYPPQTFTSAKETENYDSDGLVAYGEKFTAITARVVEKHTSVQLTLRVM